MKLREKPGRIIFSKTAIKEASTTKVTAAPVPVSLLRATFNTLFGLPPGTKSLPGVTIRLIPVKD